MAEKNAITKQGLEDIKNELQQLIDVEQPKANEELNFARSQGDLSENADYDAAKEKYEKIKRRIQELNYIVDHHIIIEETDDIGPKTAKLGGSAITVLDLSRNTTKTVTIVGSVESDPFNGKISNTCPVAQAIIGHRIGDVVTVNAKVPYQLKIVDIA